MENALNCGKDYLKRRTEMKAYKVMCAVLALAVFMTGCSSLRSNNQSITVSANQPDCEIYVNGAMIGQTASVSVPRDQNVYIIARKEGYITVQRTIETSKNLTGKLDTLGSIFILPAFGLLCAGSKSLNEQNVSIVMVKREEKCNIPS